MKKYWQLRPWMVIVLILIFVAALVYAFSNDDDFYYESQSVGKTSYDYSRDSDDDYYEYDAPTMDGNYDYAEKYEAYVTEESSVLALDTGSGNSSASEIQRMVVKNGSLSMVVDDVRKSAEDITTFAEGKGGFLVSNNIDKSGLDLSGYVSIRVPSEFLEETILFVKNLGEIQNEHVNGRDITEQYIDLEAQLKNLRATEDQFLLIMDKAEKVEDILLVQKELGYIREDIERIEGRVKYLKDSVDLSSLTVYLSTNPSTLPVIDEQEEWKVFAVFKDALRSMLDTSKFIVNSLIWFGVYIPIIAAVLLIAWAVRRHYKKGKRK
ncbi:DUF4349 domain-containing protein [Patescibacteria group bacterium]|nr:DUF4349 domain-containing protein [Patescibacteria group bacterium]